MLDRPTWDLAACTLDTHHKQNIHQAEYALYTEHSA